MYVYNWWLGECCSGVIGCGSNAAVCEGGGGLYGGDFFFVLGAIAIFVGLV